MAKVYGIDLGTTYSVIATLDDNGTPEVIQNYNDGGDLLASAVFFPEGGMPVIGKEAKNQVEVEGHRVIQFVKRQIGKSNAQTYDFDGVAYDPITISALILKRMKEYADEQGYNVEDVVITCPAYFGTEERNATRQAGIIAGLNVLNIVNEPTAAALNYCCREFKENRKMMVYDLGGGTFDITLFDFSVDDAGKASIDVIKSGGDDRLGGVDWDERLYRYISEVYEDETGVDKDSMEGELRQKIRSLAEEVKRGLSSMTNKSFTVNYAGDATRIEVTREKFEELTQDLVERTMDFVRKLLTDTGVSENEVDVVLLVGGSTLMPMIKSVVEKLFPGKVRVEQPNLAVAKGAALAAAVEFNEKLRERVESNSLGSSDSAQTKESAFEDAQPPLTESQAEDLMINVPQVFSGGGGYVDKLARSFGLGVLNSSGNLFVDNLLFVGDVSPSELSREYYTVYENQEFIRARIFENVATDRENTAVTPCEDKNGNPQKTDLALKVKRIGELIVPLPPNTPKGSPLEVTFRSSARGLEVKAKVVSTGELTETVIESENTKSPEELDEAVKQFALLKTSGQI
ncbi:molecular chaperone DnaK [Clostridia bacterium]|nr:molecular chaperone DnaK [Clostridia bacterium]